MSAPAGFGKTTLLSAWAGTCGREVAWVSLDESDNDPARFWAYVATALARAGADVRPIAQAALHSPEPPSTETLLIPLLNGITETPAPLLLVLDDYHTITTRQIHEGLGFFLNHQPPHVHLAIATRADPPLPLSLLRGRGLLTELYQRDLRFTSEEAATLLNRVMDLPLSPEEIEALERRTEGWIAGLQMAAVSMRGCTDRATFVRAFSSSNRYIFDYLVEEVLRRQPPHVRRFLLRTSILDRLSGDLCEAVIRSDDGPIMPQTRSPCSNIWSATISSSSRWTMDDDGTAITISSRTCCVGDWSGKHPDSCPSCTIALANGTSSAGSPPRPCTTRSPPAASSVQRT